MVEAMNFLKSEGAQDIYACVTHSIFSGPAVARLLEAPVKEVVATNSVSLPPDKFFHKLTRLSIAPLLAEVIRRIHLGISVGELFDE